jgi:hypothetical protein
MGIHRETNKKENVGRARPNRMNLLWFTMESEANGKANTWPGDCPNSSPLCWTNGLTTPTQGPEIPKGFS